MRVIGIDLAWREGSSQKPANETALLPRLRRCCNLVGHGSAAWTVARSVAVGAGRSKVFGDSGTA